MKNINIKNNYKNLKKILFFRKDINIMLIGMPGTGKSTVGKVLSEKLNKKIIESDELIEKKYNMKLPEIIKKYGNEKFKIDEENIITESLTNNTNTIISPGGSVIYCKNLFDIIKNKEYFNKILVIYLETNFETICLRTENFSNRGIIFDENCNLYEFYKKRCELYDKYGDIKIDCNGKNLNEVVELINNLL